jgi:hypothetical protein
MKRRKITLETSARILAVVCLVFVLLLTGQPRFTNASKPLNGIRDPHLSLQRATSIAEVDAILSDDPSPDREVMRIKQYIDFGLITAYGMLFFVVAATLARAHRAGLLIGLLGIPAAILDVNENLAILRLVNTSLARTTPAMVAAVRTFSSAKWALLATTILAISIFLLFLPRWYRKVIGVAGIVSSGLVFVGLAANSVLALASLASGGALLTAAVTLKNTGHESTPRNSVSRSV